MGNEELRALRFLFEFVLRMHKLGYFFVMDVYFINKST